MGSAQRAHKRAKRRRVKFYTKSGKLVSFSARVKSRTRVKDKAKRRAKPQRRDDFLVAKW